MSKEIEKYGKEIEGLIASNQFDKAEDIINFQIQNKKFLDISFYGLGRIYLKKKDGPKASKFFLKAININSNLYQSYLGLGLSYIQDNKFIDALKSLKKYESKDSKNLSAINAMSHCYYRMEEYENALEYFQKSFKISKNQHSVILGIATVLMHLEKYKTAISYFEMLKQNENNSPSYFINFGKTLEESKKINEACEVYQEGLKHYNNNVSLLSNLGALLCDMKKYDLSKQYLKKAFEIDKSDFSTLVNLGTLFYAESNFEDSLKFYQEAYKIDPENHILMNNISASQMELGYMHDGFLEDAIKNVKKSIEYKPLYAKAHNNLSKCLYLMEDIDGSLKSGLKAFSLDPTDGLYSNNVANCYKAQGKLDLAEKYYREAIKLAPECSEAFLSLAYMNKIKPNENIVSHSEEIIKKGQLSEQDLGTFCFGLYKFYEEQNEYSKAFHYLKKANEFYTSLYGLNVENYNKLLDDQINTKKEFYSNENINRIGLGGFEDKSPIFIVGMQRSGTTLLEQILSNHPKIFGAGELTTIGRLIKNEGVEDQELSVEEFINNFNHKKRISMGKKYIDVIKNFMEKGNEYVINKMPPNYLHLGFIRLTLPGSKIIHIKRDILDNCFSLYAVRFHRGHEFSHNFETIIKTYRNYEDIMDYWEKLFPDKIYTIKYESLINDMENEIKKVLEFCDIEFHDDCLNYHNNKRIVLTASSTQVREKINSKGIERWKNYKNLLKPLTNLI